MMREVGKYDYALVYQTVAEREDGCDFEGMIAAKKRSLPLAQGLRKTFDDPKFVKILHLGAGGYGVCKVCTKRTNGS